MKNYRLNFNEIAYNEFNTPLGTVAQALAGSLNRAEARDEHVILKIGEFVNHLMAEKPFELGEADYKLFRQIVVQGDSIALIKRLAIKIMDQAEQARREGK